MKSIQLHPAIPSIVYQITHTFHPTRIILFGSYAYGNPGKGSDLDLMVILPYEGKSLDKSVEILTSLDPYPDVPLDLITCKPEEIIRRYQEGDPLIHEICIHQG